MFKVSSFVSRLYFVFRESGGTAGARATRLGNILGRGEPCALPEVRAYLSRRFGRLKVQGKSFAPVGLELSRRTISRFS